MRRRTLLGRAVALATVGIAGCSSDGDGGTSPTDTAAVTATATDTESPTSVATDTRSETPTGSKTPSPAENTATADGTDTATPTDTPTPTPSPTPTPTPIPADQRVAVGPDGTFRFDPEEFEIQAGETVAWVWEGSGHNVKPDSIPSGSDWSGTPGERTDTFDAGYTYTHTFETTGTYEYICVPHQSAGMTGSFTVVE